MDDTTKLLFQILTGFVLANMAISITLYLTSRQKEYLRLVPYWVMVGFVFIVQGAFQTHPIQIALSFTVSVIPIYYITRILLSDIDSKLSIKLYIGLIFSGLVTTLLLYRLDVSFKIFALPLSVAVASPLFEGIYWVLFKRRKSSTMIQKFMAMVMVAGIIHCINFALYRMEDGAQIWGWMVTFTLYQLFSVLLPALVVERVAKTEKQKLANINEKLLMEIEKHKQSEKSLLESEEKFSQVVSTTRDAVMIFDSETRQFVEVNKASEELYGYDREEFLKIKHYDITNEPEKSDISIKKTITRKLNLIPLRYHRKKDGTVFPVEISASVFELKGRNVVCGIIRDITERKKMEDALLQSEKLKSIGTITAGISHEFNNILAVMMGRAEVLEQGFDDDNELKKGLKTIIKAGEDGALIVKKMLTFTKSEANPSEYIFFDIRHLLEQAIDFAKPRWENMAQAGGMNYNMNNKGMKEIPEALCNPTELRGVFINVINNALDAMPDGGSLSFTTWSNDDTVFVSISDTGKGMSEDVRKKIFDPFFTTRRPQGTGLGMSVSYSVVKRHDGKIEVESEEGKGSTVNLSFPIKREIAQQKLSSKPEAHEIKAKGLRILVVEDNDDMCMIMNNALTRGGHTVKISNNGAEAIALASKEDFDLVLSDLAMPDVNGYEVVKMLNKLEKRPKIGIITGWSEQLELFDKEEMKVDFILRKPFKHIELAKQINELFGADS